MSACDNKNQSPAEKPSAIARFREELSADGSLCGVAFLGCSSEDFDVFYHWLEVTAYFTEYPFLAELTEEQTVLASGEEWYVVVPADDTLSLSVSSVYLDETDFRLKAGETLLQTENGSPVLLRGNVSDIMPNLMITLIKDQEILLEYCPSLSLKDGYLQSAEGVYDFTNYDGFFEAESENSFVTPITLYKASHTKEYLENGVQLCTGSRMTLQLNEEDSSRYPAFAGILAQKNNETLEELKTQSKFLKECAIGDERSGYYDNGYLFLSRADETVVSVRHDFRQYTGGIHSNSHTTAINYDPELGGRYALEDIISDTTGLLPLIEERLFEKYPEDTFFLEKGQVLEEYTTEDLIWTLSYQGITFYFCPYDIAPYSKGTLSVTLWFDENPRLFYDEYTYAPKEGHVISFQTYEDFEFDRNRSDNHRDSLSVGSYIFSEDETNTITIFYNENSYENKDFVFDQITPYLVCTGLPGQENYFLYLELLSGTERTLCIYRADENELTPVEVLYNVTTEEFTATINGEEVTYEKLLTPPSQY